MDKIITKVEATKARHTFASLAMPTIRKTAAYLRVSTASDEQENSFQAQSKHFTDLIKNSPNMEFIGLYADEERSYPAQKGSSQKEDPFPTGHFQVYGGA